MSNWNTDTLFLIDKFKFVEKNYLNSNLNYGWSRKAFFSILKEYISFCYLFNLKITNWKVYQEKKWPIISII